MLLIPQQLKTYSQVLTIARDVERGLEKERSQMMTKAMKEPFLKGFKIMPPIRSSDTPLTKRPFQSHNRWCAGIVKSMDILKTLVD